MGFLCYPSHKQRLVLQYEALKPKARTVHTFRQAKVTGRVSRMSSEPLDIFRGDLYEDCVSPIAARHQGAELAVRRLDWPGSISPHLPLRLP